VRHETLQPGDPCPKCKKGTVYETVRPGVLVRLVGQAPISATVYELQKLRCNLCGVVFTAQSPAGIGSEKYDASSSSMIALLKYGSGMPFNRMAGLQSNLGIPCLAHGRRQFVDVAESFPEECRYVLELLAAVYRNDATAREQKMSSSARRHFHQINSGPVMEKLHVWLGRQLEGRLVEPNSSLGVAISYMLKHWERLTLFLRVPGAPLDNNICERALKRVILHRKNALFYKTGRGAHVGDVFMSLIHTCELCGANPFDYLTELERHADELTANPRDWMPWNYQATLAGPAASSVAG